MRRDDKRSLMSIGHEIWLGDVKTEDVGAELAHSYGYNMKQDDSLDLKRITSLVLYTHRHHPDPIPDPQR